VTKPLQPIEFPPLDAQIIKMFDLVEEMRRAVATTFLLSPDEIGPTRGPTVWVWPNRHDWTWSCATRGTDACSAPRPRQSGRPSRPRRVHWRDGGSSMAGKDQGRDKNGRPYVKIAALVEGARVEFDDCFEAGGCVEQHRAYEVHVDHDGPHVQCRIGKHDLSPNFEEDFVLGVYEAAPGEEKR
jgi:hypothetical protein